jgi:hypothetical protein
MSKTILITKTATGFGYLTTITQAKGAGVVIGTILGGVKI